jgi:hypothetical protein
VIQQATSEGWIASSQGLLAVTIADDRKHHEEKPF